MNRLASAIDPLLDAAPVDLEAFRRGSLLQRLRALATLAPLLQAGESQPHQAGEGPSWSPVPGLPEQT